MAAGTGKSKGVMAFTAGVVAAPLLGSAAVITTIGLGMIWWASIDHSDAPTGAEGADFDFAAPDDIEARERPRDTKPRPRSSSRPSPSPRPSPARTADARPRPTPSAAPDAPRPTDAALPQGTVPAIPDASGAQEPPDAGGSIRPSPMPHEAEPMPVSPPPMEAPPAAAQNATAPDDGIDPLPIATRTQKTPSGEPGPHEFEEDGEPSWIPDTFRSVVEQGIAMLTGEAPAAQAPGTPDEVASVDASPKATPEPTTRTAPERTQQTRTTSKVEPSAPAGDTPKPNRPDDGVAAVAPTAAPRTDDTGGPSATPSTHRTPDPTNAPEVSALPTAKAGEPVPFGPPPEARRRDRRPAGGGETLDDIVAGGVGMMTGEGAPVPDAPAPVRTRTELEEAVEDYTDPVSDGTDTRLEFEDDLSLDIQEHDAADAFASSGDDAWVDGPTSLDQIVIPVSIRTDMPGVPVTVDGEPAGLTPTTVDLKDGTHTVVVGVNTAASRFDVQPMSNPDAWCFAEKSSGGFRQVPCD